MNRPDTFAIIMRLPRASALTPSRATSGVDCIRRLNAVAPDIPKFAFGGTGTERRDFDAVTGDLCGESLREEAVEDFGGGIRIEIWDGLEACRRSHNHNPAAAALNHARDEEAREMHHRFAVDADLRELLLDGTEMKRAELAQACVIDEDVDGKSRAFSGIVNLLRRCGVVEVCNDDADFGSLANSAASASRRSLRRAVRMSLAPWPASSRARATPIPALAPVDEGPFALEVSCVCHCWSMISDRR